MVDAEPGAAAREYVSRASKQQLEASLRSQAVELAKALTNDYAEAIMIEVAEGKISHQDAILKIEQHQDSRFDKVVDDAVRLMDKGLLSEAQARGVVLSEKKADRHMLAEGTGDGASFQENGGFDQFYEEG